MLRERQGVDLRGVFYVVVTLVGWSSVLLFLRHLAPFIDAWTANGWRYGMCALVLFPVLLAKYAGDRSQAADRSLRRPRPNRPTTSAGALPPDIWRRALAPAVFNCLGQICFGFSIYYIEPGLAAFLLRVALISATFGAFVLFADERALLRSRIFWSGMALVAAGAVGTVCLGSAPIAGATLTGILLGSSSGAFFGLYGVSVRYTMRGVPPLYSFALISTYTAAVMIGLMFWFGDARGTKVFNLPMRELSFLVFSAFLGIAVGHIFYYAAIARLGVAIAGAVVQLAPFLTGAASVVIFGEHMSRGQWLSGIMLVLGGIVLLRAERDRPRPAEAGEPDFPVELEDAGDPGALAADPPPQASGLPPQPAPRDCPVEKAAKLEGWC